MADIVMKHIYKRYEKGIEAVKDFNLEIKDKEFVIFVGPSGCGKSTTLRMIAGLEKISEGELYVDGKLMNSVEPHNRDMSMVFQSYALYPHMNVFDNIAYSMRLKHLPKREIKEKVEEVAKILGIEEILKRKPKELSGGQKQRVAMGRAIVRKPKVFLLDEPLSNLDAKMRNRMRVELLKLHKQLQTTFIYVTHDQTEAMTLGTKIVVLNDGVIQQVASPMELYEKPENVFVAQFIGVPQMNLIQGELLVQGDQGGLRVKEEFIPFDKELTSYLEELGYVGKEIIIGFRPEDILLKENSSIQIEVSVCEMLGSESHLYGEAYGKVMSIRVNDRTDIKRGDTIGLEFDWKKVHLFDGESLIRIKK